VADNNSFEQWEADGASDANARAVEIAKRTLARYDEFAPALDPAIDEALTDFIARRKRELPDAVS